MITTPRRAVPAALAALVLALSLVVVTLVWASAAQASVWVIPGTSRAFPSTTPGTTQRIEIDAAGNEYQAVQVALRGGGQHNVTFTWAAGSDPLIVANTTLRRVGYVDITHPTTDLHAAKGLYPDPLLPRSFGAATSVPGTTTCFYVQVHVPYGTAGGDYSAVLDVVNGAETVDLPVTLHVYPFGWQKLDTHTAFPLNVSLIKRSLQGSGVNFSGATKWRILDTYFSFLASYGITPSPDQVWPKVTSSGRITNAAAYASRLSPLLDDTGLDMPDARLPWLNYFPWSQSKYTAKSPRLLRYLTNLCKIYAKNGWQKKAYAYILDETVHKSQELKAQAYARVLHKASAAAGFRCRFLLTDDPRPTSLGGIKTANRFLFDDVDIWVPRYYYFFGRVPALRKLQARGKQVWWYFYANHFVAVTPSFVIEKPQTDQRVIPWLMQQWKVDGLLNWGLNRWCDPLTGTGWRDPYRNPMSSRKRDGRVANGDTSLIYPGYYPRYGLDDPYAPPVSSLRLEALRDGFQDQEYLKLASHTGAGSATFVKSVIKTITWYPYTIRQGNVYKFPKYTRSVAAFAAARAKLAARIEAYQATQ